jgi:TolB-like protein
MNSSDENMTRPAAKVFYEFSGFRLDLQQRLLTASTDNQPIALPPKAFETLLYFVERRGELLEKTAVMKAVWPNIIVEENSLNQNISVIRRALGESPGEHRFIVTEPGRGYRFVAPVTVVAAAAPRTPAASPVAETAASPAHSAPVKSVAVMPFACFSGDPEKEYFGDGMAEEIIHLLARLPGLKVPARTSSFAYKGRNADVRQIARDLDVATVLEGSVRSAGDRIRVTAQLVDGRSGFHLWSHSFDRKFEDIFRLQDELAGAILRALEVNLVGESPTAALPAPPTSSIEAYQLYLQGRALVDRANPESFLSAIRCFEQAIAIDPTFARAYGDLSSVQLSFAASTGATPDDLLSAAERCAQKSLELDPAYAQAYASLGTLSAYRARWLDAELHFRKALLLDPMEPAQHSWNGALLAPATGRLQAALRSAQESYRLSPATAPSAMVVAAANVYLGRDADVLKYMQLAVDLGMPRSFPPLPFLDAAFAMNAGLNAEAARYMRAVLAPEILEAGGAAIVDSIYAAAGAADKQVAIDALQTLRAGPARVAMTRPIMMMLATNWYTRLGALDLAFEVANTTLDELEETGVLVGAIHVGAYWLPEMRPFRRDPRFQVFVRRLGLMEYWKQFGPPDEGDLKNGELIWH